MTRLRLASIAYFLSVAACGGASQRADEDGGRNGGAGGLGGGGGTATGGGGRGGGSSAAPGLSGDYWITNDPNTFSLTVTSPTEALVGLPFKGVYEYDIIHTSGAPLGPDTGYQLPEVELTGEYVLLRRDRDPDAWRFALESGADSSRARFAFSSWPCHGARSQTVYEATLTKDQAPPEARVAPEWGIAPPWSGFILYTKRPVLAPISPGFELTADGVPVGVTWVDVTTWFGTATGGGLDDWLPLVGRTLELRGLLHGTNGTESNVLATIDVLDFGMHEGPVTFAAATTPVVALWGGAFHHTPGGLANCPDGCVSLTNEANVGMRFIRPGASLRVTAAFNGLSIDLMAPDGTGATVPTPQGGLGVIETADIPIPFQTDDLFAVFRGPYPIMAGNCPTPSNVAYLVSVEPAGAP